MNNKLLVVITGPTAVGKTDSAIVLAKHYNTDIISCDSRQFYRELNIGTAKPDSRQLKEVKHHFIGNISIHDYYNVSKYEKDVLGLLNTLFKDKNIVIMCGGSGLYIDAVCSGIDDFPDPSPELRATLKNDYLLLGISDLREKLKAHDPCFYEEVDNNNPVRMLRALEVCLSTGKPYSQQRLNQIKTREFKIIKLALNLPREILFDRINLRTIKMMESGLLDEALQYYPMKYLNALKTVGYRELFDYFDGNCSLELAVEKIKTNARRYAKRQLTWFNRDLQYYWYSPMQIEEIQRLIDSQLNE